MILLSLGRPPRCHRPQAVNELATRYNAAAPRWHGTMQRLGYPRAYTRLLDELRQEGVPDRWPPSPRVLDCGLGTGVLAMAFARVVPAVTIVTGIDVSSGMLHHAAANLAAAGVTAELQQADARCLPYRDGEFDAVLSAHMLEHLSAPRVALGEMARVLRPGGLLIVVAVRATVVDAAIRLKWDHAPIRPGDLGRWMTLEDIRDVRSHALGSVWRPVRWLSRAFVGRKGNGLSEKASSVAGR
ncbi:MAG: class I SAM-dependent methyltransferase [bacterium]